MTQEQFLKMLGSKMGQLIGGDKVKSRGTGGQGDDKRAGRGTKVKE